MSAVYGISGFVEGFMGGRDKRNEWEDRKLDRARQAKFDELSVGADKRSAEEHARRIRILDQQIAGTDKALAAQAAEEKMYLESVDATKAAMDADQAGMGIPGVDVAPAAPPAPAATSGRQSLPLGLPSMDSRSAAMMERMAPADVVAAQAAKSSIPVSLPSTLPLGRPGATTAIAPPRALVEAVQKQNADIGPAGGPTPKVDLAALYDQIEKQSAALGLTGVAIPVYDGKTTDAAYAEAKKRAAAAADAEREDAQTVENLRRQAFEDGPLPIEWRRDAAEKLRGMGYIPADPQGKTLKKVGVGAPVNMEAAPGPRIGKTPPPDSSLKTSFDKYTASMGSTVPASAPPVVKQMSATAAETLKATSTPAIDAAAQAASMGLPKPKPGAKVTEATRDKYAKGFMDHYMKVGAPMVLEGFLKTGQFDKATAFQEFISRTETKAGMDNWAKAAFAASTGDMDAFADNVLQAYNRLGYFGDDTTIVEDESGFTHDKAGNITGAKITFKDEKTGNTFDQVFTDPNDLVKMGITLLAPDQAFEYFYKQQEAAVTASLGLKKEQAATEKADKTALDNRIDVIMEQSSDPLNPRKDADGNPLPPMTYAEARAEAAAQLGADQTAGAGVPAAPPVAHRPGA